ncbi:tetratricopeptide repeat domain-containing protein [Phthorimaea operculella]|nr:tetratricopeptide repeat domain-containing protein [Phthorimaea operculella]
MSDVKIIAASIVNFLNQQLQVITLSEGAIDSLEVAVQCVETAFDLGPGNVSQALDLLDLLRQQRTSAEAEALKNDANDLMKAKRYSEALETYDRAVELNPRSAVYLCNRAAAHFRLGNNQSAVEDCRAALAIQPNYAKAHGRLGLALSALNNHRAAYKAYEMAVQLDPGNASYSENLRLTEDFIAQQGPDPNESIFPLHLQNPLLVSMAAEIFSDPGIRNLVSNFSGQPGEGISTLLQIGNALVEQLHATGFVPPAQNPPNGNPQNGNVPNQNAPGNQNQAPRTANPADGNPAEGNAPNEN